VDSIAEYFEPKTVSKTRCEIAGVSDITNHSDQRVIVNQWISE